MKTYRPFPDVNLSKEKPDFFGTTHATPRNWIYDLNASVWNIRTDMLNSLKDFLISPWPCTIYYIALNFFKNYWEIKHRMVTGDMMTSWHDRQTKLSNHQWPSWVSQHQTQTLKPSSNLFPWQTFPWELQNYITVKNDGEGLVLLFIIFCRRYKNIKFHSNEKLDRFTKPWNNLASTVARKDCKPITHKSQHEVIIAGNNI